MIFQLFLGCLGGQADGDAVHPDLLAALLLVADIDLAGRILTHEDDRQARRNALCLQGSHALGNAGTQFVGHELAVKQLCGHRISLHYTSLSRSICAPMSAVPTALSPEYSGFPKHTRRFLSRLWMRSVTSSRNSADDDTPPAIST